MESTLQIQKANAVTAYKEADDKGKALLVNLFGKSTFVPEKITDRVKTFEDACSILGIQPYDIEANLQCEALPDDIKSIKAYAKLIIIARALNEGWTPDWSNSKQLKYTPWFEHKSGFGLSSYDCDGWTSYAYVGSRLCYKTAELARYAATQFADIYNDYLTLQ